MFAKLKDLIGIAKPGGLDDFVVRTVKTGVAVFLAQPFVALLQKGALDLNAGKAALYAAAATVVSAVLNAALLALAKFARS